MPGDWEVLRATHPHEKLQAFTARWSIPIAKEGATTLALPHPRALLVGRLPVDSLCGLGEP